MRLRSAFASIAFASVLVAFSCTPVPVPEDDPGSTEPASDAPIAFDYVALDGNHVTSATTRNRATAVVFLTTYDLPSQVIMRELADLMHRAKPRFNALGVVLEPPKNAPLVEAFATTLELPFPITLAPVTGSFEMGAFGKVDAVPTTIVLDRSGRERFRRAGAISTEILERALADASH